MSNLFSYIMKDDTGFAPCVDPACQYLSLACCKPVIRSVAEATDWILGFGGRRLSEKSGRDVVGRLIYAARISKVVDFDSYYSNPMFKGRVDNIYHSVDGMRREWIQTKNPYHVERKIRHDTKANRVLISNHFLYFGPSGPKIEEIGNEFSKLLKKGPGHKKFRLDGQVEPQRFVEYLESKFEFNKCSVSTQAGKHKPCDECG